MKQRILFDEKEYPTDYVILELNPALEALLKCDKSYIGKKGSEIHPLQMSRYLKICHLIFSENKKIKYTILLQADRLLLQCFDHISEYPGLCGYFYG